MSLLDRRPYVFIGSSSEAKSVAEAIQTLLSPICEAEIWSQDFFELGAGALENLVTKVGQFDFAVLIATCDDKLVFRGEEMWAPRDNVVLELGLFFGVLGVKRTFLIAEDAPSKKIKLPSDLDITLAKFSRPQRQSLSAALGPAATKISTIIENRGCRPESQNIDSSLKVDIYYRNRGFDRFSAIKMQDRISSLGIQCRIMAHGAKKQPDAIFVGSLVSGSEIRAVVSSIGYPIKYIFHSTYPESEGGDNSGRKIGIGYDASYVGAVAEKSEACCKPVSKRQLNWILNEETTSAEIQAFLACR